MITVCCYPEDVQEGDSMLLPGQGVYKVDRYARIDTERSAFYLYNVTRVKDNVEMQLWFGHRELVNKVVE